MDRGDEALEKKEKSQEGEKKVNERRQKVKTRSACGSTERFNKRQVLD